MKTVEAFIRVGYLVSFNETVAEAVVRAIDVHNQGTGFCKVVHRETGAWLIEVPDLLYDMMMKQDHINLHFSLDILGGAKNVSVLFSRKY